MSLRILLSLMGLTTTEPCTFKHVVMEVSDMDNREIFYLVGKSMVETVVAHDVMGRLMIQCALQVQNELPRIGLPHPMQAGLAHVLRELISFDGSEIYGAEWPQLVGRTFDQACFAFR